MQFIFYSETSPFLKRKKRFRKLETDGGGGGGGDESDHDLETVNAYANLVRNIKVNVEEVGAVSVDLMNTGDSNEINKK